jgi:hypothetical protein
MNKIVRANYPASKLPEDLREGIDPTSHVTVVISQEERPEHVMSLEEIFAARKPPFRSAEDIVADIRQLRDEWDD